MCSTIEKSAQCRDRGGGGGAVDVSGGHAEADTACGWVAVRARQPGARVVRLQARQSPRYQVCIGRTEHLVFPPNISFTHGTPPRCGRAVVAWRIQFVAWQIHLLRAASAACRLMTWGQRALRSARGADQSARRSKPSRSARSTLSRAPSRAPVARHRRSVRRPCGNGHGPRR